MARVTRLRRTIGVMLAICASLASGALAGPALQQASEHGRRVTLTGLVLDPSGAVVPGADVELLSIAVDGQEISLRHVVTDGGGRFAFEHVTPGAHAVRATLEGFDVAAQRVDVSTRAPALVRLTLAVARVTQETTVTNSPLQPGTTATANANAIVADQQALQELPAF